MIEPILKIFSNISGWFSTERVDRRHRKKIGKLEDELQKLIKEPQTDRNNKRVEHIMHELVRLRKDFTS